jgi:AAA+ ATPase superfamily predicted ATPase
MTLTNPYRMRGMIPRESDMFFGRKSEMRRIGAMLSGVVPQCVSIIGERRIGKSSLAFRVFHKMRSEDKTLAVGDKKNSLMIMLLSGIFSIRAVVTG